MEICGLSQTSHLRNKAATMDFMGLGETSQLRNNNTAATSLWFELRWFLDGKYFLAVAKMENGYVLVEECSLQILDVTEFGHFSLDGILWF